MGRVRMGQEDAAEEQEVCPYGFRQVQAQQSQDRQEQDPQEGSEHQDEETV